MKVMHLELRKHVRQKLLLILTEAGHTVTSHCTYRSAIKDENDYDLYVVGHLNGVHGPDFALDKVMQGGKVLMLGEYQKLSKIPFVPFDALDNVEMLLNKVNEVVTGGK